MTGFFEELTDSNIDSMEIKIRGLQNKLKKSLPTGMNTYSNCFIMGACNLNEVIDKCTMRST